MVNYRKNLSSNIINNNNNKLLKQVFRPSADWLTIDIYISPTAIENVLNYNIIYNNYSHCTIHLSTTDDDDDDVIISLQGSFFYGAMTNWYPTDRFIALARVECASIDKLPKLIAPVTKRFTIFAADSTSLISKGWSVNLKSNWPLKVHALTCNHRNKWKRITLYKHAKEHKIRNYTFFFTHSLLQCFQKQKTEV